MLILGVQKTRVVSLEIFLKCLATHNISGYYYFRSECALTIFEVASKLTFEDLGRKRAPPSLSPPPSSFGGLSPSPGGLGFFFVRRRLRGARRGGCLQRQFFGGVDLGRELPL